MSRKELVRRIRKSGRFGRLSEATLINWERRGWLPKWSPRWDTNGVDEYLVQIGKIQGILVVCSLQSLAAIKRARLNREKAVKSNPIKIAAWSYAQRLCELRKEEEHAKKAWMDKQSERYDAWLKAKKAKEFRAWLAKRLYGKDQPNANEQTSIRLLALHRVEAKGAEVH